MWLKTATWSSLNLIIDSFHAVIPHLMRDPETFLLIWIPVFTRLAGALAKRARMTKRNFLNNNSLKILKAVNPESFI